MCRSGLRRSPELERSGHAAFMMLERGVRDLYGVDEPTPLAPAQWHALLSIWSLAHGFANLTLAGQFDGFTPPDGQAALLRETLAPMMQAHLLALRPQPIKARARPKVKPPR